MLVNPVPFLTDSRCRSDSFHALFGIATDDGLVMATYLDQSFANNQPRDREAIRASLMTTAATLLALLPILTSAGHGSDIMMPMAIPTFGGMTVALLSMFVVPVLYCAVKEIRSRFVRPACVPQ